MRDEIILYISFYFPKFSSFCKNWCFYTYLLKNKFYETFDAMHENPDNCTLCVVIISTINNFSLLRHHLFLPSSFTKFLYCYNKCKKLIQWNQIAIYTQPSLSSSLFSSAQFLKYVKEIIRETHIIVYQYTFLLATHTYTPI